MDNTARKMGETSWEIQKFLSMLTKMASGRKTDGKTHHCAPENSIIMTFGQIGSNWTIGSAQEKITATQNHISTVFIKNRIFIT